MSLWLKRRMFIAMASSSGSGTPDDPIVTPESYDPSAPKTPNSSTIYQGSPGEPKVTTDENGKVTQYEFTNTGTTGVTTQNVDTGIIAFDQSNPGWTLHLVAEFTPNLTANSRKNIIQAYQNERGLRVYGASSYCYKEIKVADNNSNQTYTLWSRFNVISNKLQTVTFDVTYSNDKKYSMKINGIEHFSNLSVNYTFSEGITIKIANDMTNFTIKEFTVNK